MKKIHSKLWTSFLGIIVGLMTFVVDATASDWEDIEITRTEYTRLTCFNLAYAGAHPDPIRSTLLILERDEEEVEEVIDDIRDASNIICGYGSTYREYIDRIENTSTFIENLLTDYPIELVSGLIEYHELLYLSACRLPGVDLEGTDSEILEQLTAPSPDCPDGYPSGASYDDWAEPATLGFASGFRSCIADFWENSRPEPETCGAEFVRGSNRLALLLPALGKAIYDLATKAEFRRGADDAWAGRPPRESGRRYREGYDTPHEWFEKQCTGDGDGRGCTGVSPEFVEEHEKWKKAKEDQQTAQANDSDEGDDDQSPPRKDNNPDPHKPPADLCMMATNGDLQMAYVFSEDRSLIRVPPPEEFRYPHRLGALGTALDAFNHCLCQARSQHIPSGDAMNVSIWDEMVCPDEDSKQRLECLRSPMDGGERDPASGTPPLVQLAICNALLIDDAIRMPDRGCWAMLCEAPSIPARSIQTGNCTCITPEQQTFIPPCRCGQTMHRCAEGQTVQCEPETPSACICGPEYQMIDIRDLPGVPIFEPCNPTTGRPCPEFDR